MKTLARSFAGGEITPELYGRLDLSKYQTGLALCENMITLPHGPAARRPGFQFVAEVDHGNQPVRLIPFAYSATATAILEFSQHGVRIIINGQLLVEESRTVSSVNPANGQITLSANAAWPAGRHVAVGGRVLRVQTVVSSNVFVLEDFGGSLFVPSSSLVGTQASLVYRIPSFYSAADLPDFHYAQDNEVLTVVHPAYAAREIRRVGPTNWTVTVVTFATGVPTPTNVTVAATVSVSGNQSPCGYVVTAVADDNVSESLPSAQVTVSNNLSAAGNYNTIRHDFLSGVSRYRVYKRRGGLFGYIGQTTSQDGVPVSSATWVSDTVTIGTSEPHGLVTGDEVFLRDFGPSQINGRAAITVTSSTQFTFSRTGSGTVSPIGTYLWYRPVVDDNVQADLSTVPPEQIYSLNVGAGNYPAAVTYYEQRRWFAGSDNEPQTVYATRNGTASNLTSSVPTRDDDALKFRIAAQQQNRIRHVVPLGDLIAFTVGGEFRIYAEDAPVITPTTLSVKPQGYAGSSSVMPIATNGSILYVQAQGSRIRELAYSWQNSAYSSIDVSLMAPHLFDGYTITDLAYSRAPVPLLWAVRSDGALLGMTYVPEQQVYGWHRHRTDGEFERVAVVAEGLEDTLYVVTKRTINGRTCKFVEKMKTRFFDEQEDAFFVDAGLTYSGSPVTTISNLWHLEGKEVAALADGAVVPQQTVVNGSITLEDAASVVHVGLPYESRLQTLPLVLETNAGGQFATKNVNAVAIRVSRSSLIQVGPSFDRLTEYPPRAVADPMGSPPSLTTEQIRLAISPQWGADGAICIAQSDPVPLTVLQVAFDVAVGG